MYNESSFPANLGFKVVGTVDTFFLWEMDNIIIKRGLFKHYHWQVFIDNKLQYEIGKTQEPFDKFQKQGKDMILLVKNHIRKSKIEKIING